MKKFFRLCTYCFFIFFSIYSSPAVCHSQTLSVNNPAWLQGTVTDFNNGSPIANVTVTAMAADTFFTETAANGTYSLTVDEDTYDVSFELIGLKTVIVSDTFAAAGLLTEVSVSLCDEPYPVPWVFADPNQADTEILITWGAPEGPYEVIYEDGTAEDFFMWAQTGAASAVRFTPNGYPATVEGGRVFVGDGSFPSGADFLGEDFSIGVLDDDGPDGLPGTVLDSITVTVDNYYWVEFEGLNTVIDSGDFYLVMWQLETPPQAAPIGIDNDFPKAYRSYLAPDGSTWSSSPYQDFMLRATVSSKNQNTSFVKYDVSWIDGFDPDAGEGPEDGILHHRAYPGLPVFNEWNWGPQPPGFYAWAVRALYACDTSVWTYSNVVAHLLDNEVRIRIDLSNDSTPENVNVLMVGNNYPYQEFQEVATVLPGDSLAEMFVDSAIDGLYDLHVSKAGFEDYVIEDVEILTDSVVPAELQELTYPVRNLFVDSLTSVATWDVPLITQLALEDFEEETFPPEGWAIDEGTGGMSWTRENDGWGEFFQPPPGDGFYAFITSTVGPTATDVYLITPELDLRQSQDFTLNFDHYFTGLHNTDASIKYSTDSCLSWTVLEDISAVEEYAWESIKIDLSSISGKDSIDRVWLAFYVTDHSSTGSGWAVDNVSVTAGQAAPTGYYVYLDGALVDETTADDTSFFFPDLIYGQTYTASVRADYSSGLSEPVEYTWTSGYLYPPREQGNTYQTDEDQVPLFWLPPMKIDSIVEKAPVVYGPLSVENRDTVFGHVPDGLTAFKIYRDGEWIGDVAYNGEGVNDTLFYTTPPLDPADYVFQITAIYDLEVFGFPGEVGESAPDTPDTVRVIWGNELPFLESWDEGGFAINGWRLEGDGWVISNDIGDPEPSAEFLSAMIIGDSVYSATLTSNPLLGTGLTEGDIYLDFNLRLDDLNPTGEEKLLVEITDDAGKTWHQLPEIDNLAGSFDFEEGFYHINISKYAMGKAFHIRFTASGQNASDIEAWFIDNIHVFRSCRAPDNLEGTYVWQAGDWGAEIKWDAPELPVEGGGWLFWDNSVYDSGVGLTSGGTWSIAQRWDAGQLKDWNGTDWTGTQITKMSFVLNDDGFSKITLKIWSGPQAGTLLYEQDVNDPVIGDWLEVSLDEPVDFDTDEELWIGYTIHDQPANRFPGAIDEGSAVPGYGDMISIDDGATWDRLSEYGFNNNWLIHAYAAPPSSGSPIAPAGFNLYRQEVEIDDDYLLYDFVTFTEDQYAYSYFDKAPAVSSGQTYNYKVTSWWQSETDSCESVPALTIPMTEDYVTVLVTAVEDEKESGLSLFPNPAANSLHLRSTVPVKRIRVFNYTGQVVFDRETGGVQSATINTSLFESGVYLLRIHTANGVLTKRVVVSR
ncbi:MAG: choice-of-anchor J domain-containing protein [Bacteroidales bacterium]|nr:choice-of-anchor J domain-containing protein [Bacteroidales bacterium]